MNPYTSKSISFVASGPKPFSQLIWLIVAWVTVGLITSIGLHLYVITDDSENRARQVQLWIGHSGFLGTIISGCIAIVTIFALLFLAYYSKLISLDLKTLQIYTRDFGERFIYAIRQYDFANSFLNLLSRPTK